MFQIDNVYAGDRFFHVTINSNRDIFVNDENVVSKSLEKCTLRNQTNLMRWRKVPMPCSAYSLT